MALQKHGYDHIESYLSEGLVPTEAIENSGGYLKYWNNLLQSRPSIARMALDFISAPGNCSDTKP